MSFRVRGGPPTLMRNTYISSVLRIDRFDLFGGPNKRKSGAPDEILMFCLDCSVSMSKASDFEEIRDEEDTHGTVISAPLSPASVEEDGTFSPPSLDEMKGKIIPQKGQCIY